MRQVEAGKADAVAQLCPSCGLCCNGVLFADVELRRGDRAARLEALGLDLFRKGSKRCFKQPCGCFDGGTCQIYKDRPAQCRAFECRLLQRVDAGVMTSREALKKIKAVRGQVDRLRKRVRELGQTNERMSLNERYAAIMAGPIALADGENAIGYRSELMNAFGALARVLEADFLT